MDQSIIVYRNPVEKAVWEGLCNGDVVSSVVIGFVIFFLVYATVLRGLKYSGISCCSQHYAVISSIGLLVSGVCGIIAMYLGY